MTAFLWFAFAWFTLQAVISALVIFKQPKDPADKPSVEVQMFRTLTMTVEMFASWWSWTLLP